MPYSDRLLDHYRNPRHRGLLQHATHEHHERNPLCGDEVTMRLRVAGGHIQEAAFEGVGCVYCIAAADLLCVHATGRPADAIAALPDDDAIALLHVPVPAGRRDCATLALVAARKALQ